MKKYLILASAALIALAACNKEPLVQEPTQNEGSAVLTFTSKRPELGTDTKTAWNATTKSIVWTEQDKIRVGYTLNGNWMARDAQADFSSDPKKPAKFFSSGDVSIDSNDAGLGTFTVPKTGQASFTYYSDGEAVFYGVYPGSAVDVDAYSAPYLSVTLPTSQTPGDNTFDSSADIMVGKTDEITLSGSFPNSPIDIKWNRIVAHADLTFSGLTDDGEETVSKITLTFNEEAKAAGSFNVNITNGEVTTNNNSKNEIILSGSNLSLSDHSVKAWVSLMPITFTSLNVAIETNKAIYTRAISATKTFAKNTRNILTINMAGEGATRTPKKGQLVADGYYVISCGDHMMTVGTESESYRGSAQKNVTKPDDVAIWKIAYVSDSDAYTIHSLGANKDLYGATTTTSTSLTLGSGTTKFFTIEKSNSEATTYKIAPVENTSRAIGYNTSSPRFALYAGGTQQPITLDLTAVTVDETPVITIADEEKTKEVEANAPSVSFTYVPNMFATEAPSVAVANDVDHIINGTPTAVDGSITVTLNPNDASTAKTATLTVSGAGITSPITLTINQKAKLGDVFSYVFTSKDWKAMRGEIEENWTGTSGSQLESSGSARGVQIQTSASGANATSPFSFTNVSKVTITLAKSGSGAGSVAIKVGDTTVGTQTTFTTTATDYSFNVNNLNGKVSFVVTCSNNSIYVKGVSITASSINLPTAYSITCATGLLNGTIEASKTSAYEDDEITLTANPDDGYQLGEWTVTEATSGNAVAVTDGKFTMPADNINVTATFVEKVDGDPTTVSMSSFTAISGDVGGDENVSYAASKGDASTAPAVNSNEIRIYQNGGLLTITANNGKKITAITIGSSMATKVQTKVDNGNYSSDNEISANGTYTIESINATTVVFKCTGTDKTSRLYLNSLSVTYK